MTTQEADTVGSEDWGKRLCSCGEGFLLLLLLLQGPVKLFFFFLSNKNGQETLQQLSGTGKSDQGHIPASCENTGNLVLCNWRDQVWIPFYPYQCSTQPLQLLQRHIQGSFTSNSPRQETSPVQEWDSFPVFR